MSCETTMLVTLILVVGVLRILGKIANGIRAQRATVQVAAAHASADQVNLAQQQAAQLTSPAAVNMTHVKDMAKQDPKLVAQVVKGWVATDG